MHLSGRLIETYLCMTMPYRWCSPARISFMCLINAYSMTSPRRCLHLLNFWKDAGGGEGRHLSQDLCLPHQPVILEVTRPYQDPFLPLKIVVPERSMGRASHRVVDHHQTRELVFVRVTNVRSFHLPQDTKQHRFPDPGVVSWFQNLPYFVDLETLLMTVTAHFQAQ